jgi:hypothetical protein
MLHLRRLLRERETPLLKTRQLLKPQHAETWLTHVPTPTRRLGADDSGFITGAELFVDGGMAQV